MAVVPLSGCATDGILTGTDTTDSLVTGSIAPAPAATEYPEKASDTATIRNAVTSANLEELDGAEIAWANRDTGSQGAITAVEEYRKDGQICRRFEATRESFEGVSLHRGIVCLNRGGQWRLREFGPAQARIDPERLPLWMVKKT